MLAENHLFIIPVGAGLIFAIGGFVMLKFPPKNINGLYGYRTSSSMKSKERWDFAQLYSSKEMIKLALLLALSGVLEFIVTPKPEIGMIIGLGLIILVVIALIVRVEKAIKKKFKS